MLAKATHIVDTVMASTIPTGDASSTIAPPPYQPSTTPSTEPPHAQPTGPPQPPPAKSKISTVLAILTPKLTNKKYISTINGSITGSWTIDTSLVVPRLMRGSTAYNERPETRPNLRFGTINGPIKVDLTVLGEYDLDQRERVSIVLGTVNGKIQCAILDRADKSLDLGMSSINGSIEIRLPVDFCGSVAFSSTKGPITFSEDVQARLDAPLRNVLSGTGTIGPPASKSAAGAASHQFNDSLRFSTINGPVFVSFYEPGPPKEDLLAFRTTRHRGSRRHKGLLGSLLRSGLCG